MSVIGKRQFRKKLYEYESVNGCFILRLFINLIIIKYEFQPYYCCPKFRNNNNNCTCVTRDSTLQGYVM